MAGVNKCILVGNLGADPELRFTSGGQAVADLRLATSRKFKARNGEQQEETEWHRIVVWGEQAEHCKRYLDKGRQVYVEGRLQTRKWTDKDGRDRWTTEINAQTVQFLSGGGAQRDAPSDEAPQGDAAPASNPMGTDPVAEYREALERAKRAAMPKAEDDIPF